MPRKADQSKVQKVYEYISAYVSDKGYAPSVRDISSGCSIPSTSTVARILKTLADKGMIGYDGMKSRSIRLMERSEEKFNYLPVVGQVAGGAPILAEQHVEDMIPLPASRFGNEGMFLLNVHGNSMKNIGICDGDMVVVKPADTALNGEIVVARIDDEATVKRFFKEDGHYRLQPENEEMTPIITDHVEIEGIVTDVIHRIGSR